MRPLFYHRFQGWPAIGLVLLTALAPQAALGAEDDTQQWSSVTLKYGITPEISANFMTRARFDEDISHKKDVLIRPWISIKGTDGMSIALGYDRIEPFPSSAGYENRVWQQMGLAHKFSDIPISGYLRLEERFLEDVDTTILRARQRISLEIPVPDTSWYMASFNEVFVNLNSDSDGPRSGFDQNWLFFGPGRKFGEHLNAKFGYQWVHQRKRGPNENVHALVLSLTIQLGNSK
jgi:hypothetical protein